MLLRGQGFWVSHSFDNVSEPLHFFPPHSGSGLVQLRVKVSTPLPQEAEHG